MRVFCLSDNTPLLTALGNDMSYDVVFADPLAVLAEPGDVAFALSGSGNSPNVLRAMEVAEEMGLTRIGLTGRDGGALAALVRRGCDRAHRIDADHRGRAPGDPARHLPGALRVNGR